MTASADDSFAVGALVPVESSPWIDRSRYDIHLGKTTIGRAVLCDIRVNHPTVSRAHAELIWEDGRLTLFHLSPVNPTFVNGIPVTEARELRDGDLLEIANVVSFRIEAPGDEEMATEPGLRLASRMYAIVHADVAGYSRLVEADATATAQQLEACLEIIRIESENAGGHIVQIAGDGVLLLFNSTLSAVKSVVSWQHRVMAINQALPSAKRMDFRVGINVGDIVITPSGGRHGDAINIAARIQALAEPGGAFVTGIVRDQIQGHADYGFEEVAVPPLKNISQEVRVYRVRIARRL